MSTAGIAMHYKSRSHRPGENAVERERAARLAARDAAYRAALRIPPHEALPSVLGNVTHNRATACKEVFGGGRMSTRPDPIASSR